MCILFIFVDPSPREDGFRLILASNRDEFYRRPTKKASECAETHVIAGRDMEIGKENGSWLGASAKERENVFKFRCGALLNLTGEQRPNATKGRGNIVVDYLESSLTASEYVEKLRQYNEEIHPYNFVALQIGENKCVVSHSSNWPGTTDGFFEGKQILGFGNSGLKCPLKKVLFGKSLFEEIVRKFNKVDSKKELYQQLVTLLREKDRHLPDEELKRRAPNWYEQLSSIFVEIPEPGYGTRTHSIIMVDYHWNYHFFEDTMEEPINIENVQWGNTVICN